MFSIYSGTNRVLVAKELLPTRGLRSDLVLPTPQAGVKGIVVLFCCWEVRQGLGVHLGFPS